MNELLIIVAILVDGNRPIGELKSLDVADPVGVIGDAEEALWIGSHHDCGRILLDGEEALRSGPNRATL